MIEQAYIFSSLGKAAFQQEGEWFVLDAAAPEDIRKWHSLDRNLLSLSATPETLYLEGGKQLEEVKKLLAIETEKQQALTLALQLMDSSITGTALNDTIATLLEKYLEKKRVFAFVENRLLTTVTPHSFKPAAALESCILNKLTTSSGLFQTLLSAANSSQAFYTCWQKNAALHFQNPEAFDTAYALLTEQGMAREFVLSIAQSNRLRWDTAVLEATYLLQERHLLPNAALFVQIRQDLQRIFGIQFEENIDSGGKPARQDELAQMIEAYLEEEQHLRTQKRSRKDLSKLQRKKENRQRTRKKVQVTDVEALQNTVQEYCEKITESIRIGNIAQVDDDLKYLLQLQFKHSDPRHICMSLCQIADSVFEIGAIDLAKRLLNYAKILNPDDIFVDTQFAEIFKAEGDLKSAKAEYERIRKIFPENVVAQNGYAEILKAEGDIQSAKFEYERIKKLFPDDVVAQSGYAEVLKAEGDIQGAKAEYERIKSQFPNDVVSLNGYAEILKAEGDIQGAKVEYERNKKLFPHDIVAQNGYAEILKALGDIQGAKAEYERIISKYPYNEVAKRALCFILLSLNKKIEFDIPYPQNPKSKNDFYWHYFHITSQIKMGEWQAAENALRLGIANCQFHDTKVHYKRTLRYLALQKREFNAALAELSPVEENQPLDFALRTHLYAATNQIDLAKAELKKSLQFQQIQVIQSISYLLSERFDLNGLPRQGLPHEVLDVQIQEQEFQALLTIGL